MLHKDAETVVRFLCAVGDFFFFLNISLVISKVVGVVFQRSLAKYPTCLKYCVLE